MQEFSKRLKKIRKEMGFSQVRLGKILDYGSTAIANYESGRNEPSLNDLRRIADCLEVSVDYLLGRTEDKRLSYKTPQYQQISLADILELIDENLIKNDLGALPQFPARGNLPLDPGLPSHSMRWRT